MQKIVAFGSPKGCATLSRVFHPNGEFTRAFVGAVRKVLEQSSGNQTHVKQFGLIRNTCPHLGDFRSWFSMFMLDVPAKDESRKISELTTSGPGHDRTSKAGLKAHQRSWLSSASCGQTGPQASARLKEDACMKYRHSVAYLRDKQGRNEEWC